MSKHEKGHQRVARSVATLLDGSTIAKGVTTEVVDAGLAYIEVTIPDLRYIEEILHLQTHTDPPVDIESNYGNKNISANVVGITVAGIAAGTTLSLEALALGP